ncbi:hypothetical protein SLE2022_254320 [Rubroshorea leprosula]
MKEYQTAPQKEHSRSSEISGRRSKESHSRKPSKILKKSLNPEFTKVYDDVLSQITDEPIDFSSVSEISDSNYTSDLTDNFVLSSEPPLLALSETSTLSNITPCTKFCAVSEDGKISGSKVGSAEVETMSKLLSQVDPNSIDLDFQSRKLIDALTEAVLHEIYGKPEERDLVAKVVSMRRSVVLVCFFLWILVVLMILLLSSESHDTFHGHVPT